MWLIYVSVYIYVCTEAIEIICIYTCLDIYTMHTYVPLSVSYSRSACLKVQVSWHVSQSRTIVRKKRGFRGVFGRFPQNGQKWVFYTPQICNGHSGQLFFLSFPPFHQLYVYTYIYIYIYIYNSMQMWMCMIIVCKCACVSVLACMYCARSSMVNEEAAEKRKGLVVYGQLETPRSLLSSAAGWIWRGTKPPPTYGNH